MDTKTNINTSNIDNMINKLQSIENQWTIGFHIHPKQSIPHLHMHVISTDRNIMNEAAYKKETKPFTDTDGKFVSAVTVLKYLSGKYENEVATLNGHILEWSELGNNNIDKWRTEQQPMRNAELYKFPAGSRNTTQNTTITYPMLSNKNSKTASVFKGLLKNSYGSGFNQKGLLKKNTVIRANTDSIIFLDQQLPKLFIHNLNSVKGFGSTSILHYLVIPRNILIYNVISLKKRHVKFVISMCELAMEQINITNNMSIDTYSQLFTNLNTNINSTIKTITNKTNLSPINIKSAFKNALNKHIQKKYHNTGSDVPRAFVHKSNGHSPTGFNPQNPGKTNSRPTGTSGTTSTFGRKKPVPTQSGYGKLYTTTGGLKGSKKHSMGKTKPRSQGKSFMPSIFGGRKPGGPNRK